MSLPERLASLVTTYTKTAIALMLVLTLVVGSGVGMVEQSSSLDQFESENDEVEAQEYIDEHFVAPGQENITQVQVIVRGENVLTRESVLSTLEYQQALHDDAEVNDTLAEDDPITGVSNLIAITAIQNERAEDIETRNAELEADQETLEEDTAELEARAGALEDALNETRALQTELDEVERQFENDEIDEETYEAEQERIEGEISVVVDDATSDLTAEQAATFEDAAGQLRALVSDRNDLVAAQEEGADNQTEIDDIDESIGEVYELGTVGVFEDEFDELDRRGDELAERGDEIEADQEELQSTPSLDEQIEHVEGMDDDEFEDVVTTVLDPDDGQDFAFQLMPTGYEPGSTSSDARMMIVRQDVADAGDFETGDVSDVLIDSQLAMQSIGDELITDDEVIVFGFGIISEEIDRSMAESLAIVGPLALLFVVAALTIAYRDLLDILLGTAGIIAVLVWTFGFMGWAGIQFNQIFIAVPVLLIGLSIDYAIHIFMRHREQREEDGYADGDGIRRAMTVGLTGVGVALVWVTATTVFGFLSNLVSPVAPIQEFGIVSSVGIVSALLIFGVLIPALKIELDELLEGWGLDRKKRAFGTGGGRISSVLSTGAVLAKKAPLVIILLALVVSAGGALAGSQVDTSFEDEDFLADDPPDWMKNLPDAIAPGDYSAKAHFEYVNENFVRQDTQANILVRGGATDAETLERIDAAEAEAGETDTAVILSRGGADTQSPIGTMQSVADRNESFNETFTAADTTGDGVPDENIEEVYDELYEVAPDDAANVIYRTDDGEYEALLLTVSVRGSAATADVTSEMRAVAGGIDDDGTHETRNAIATGGPIVNEVIQGQLFDTVIQSLLITLVTVFAFLGGIYRIQHGSAILGVITLLPVALAVSWILGTMYLLGMPFNVLTGMITSLTVGLGVAYSIHVSERYNLELGRHESAWDAMYMAVTGTGGALLGSAATTVGGFGVLVFAILPVLQQFGIITGLTIIYAFLGSVIVLPSLLVLWTRYLGPAEKLDIDRSDDDDDPASTATSGEGTDGTTMSATESQSAGSTAAPTNTVDRRATRTVAPETLSPGEEFEVTVTVEGSEGRVVLAEEAPGEGGHVTELAPEPTDCEQVGRTLYVLWETVTPVDLRMSYVAGVPEDAAGGEAIEFDGRVMTEGGEDPLVGVEAVSIRTPVMDRLEDVDVPDEETLSEAGASAKNDDLPVSALEDIYRRWVSEPTDTDDPTPSETQAGDAGSTESHTPPADTDGGTDTDFPGDWEETER